MKTTFNHPLTVKKKIQDADMEAVRKKIVNIIKPNYNDEWLDESKHFKEAAHEVLRLLFDNKEDPN